MTCERLTEWLTTGEPSGCETLPAELQEHVKTCSDCAQVRQGVQNIQREARGLTLSAQEQSLMWQAFQKRRSETSLATPVSRPASGIPWAEWLSRLFYPALAFGVVLLVSFWFGAREVGPELAPQQGRPMSASTVGTKQSPAWAMLKGRNARLLISGRWATGDLTGQIGVAREAVVELPPARGTLTVSYADGGKITIQGSGNILVKPDGFQTREGSFTASFQRGKEPFAVRVPGAVLEIRGTEIGFVLQNGVGTLDLISGKVHVSPEAAGSLSFDWQAGVKLALQNGLVKPAPSAEPVLKPVGTVVVPAASGGETLIEPVSASDTALEDPLAGVPAAGDPGGGETDPGVATNPLSVLLRFQPDTSVATGSPAP